MGLSDDFLKYSSETCKFCGFRTICKGSVSSPGSPVLRLSKSRLFLVRVHNACAGYKTPYIDSIKFTPPPLRTLKNTQQHSWSTTFTMASMLSGAPTQNTAQRPHPSSRLHQRVIPASAHWRDAYRMCCATKQMSTALRCQPPPFIRCRQLTSTGQRVRATSDGATPTAEGTESKPLEIRAEESKAAPTTMECIGNGMDVVCSVDGGVEGTEATPVAEISSSPMGASQCMSVLTKTSARLSTESHAQLQSMRRMSSYAGKVGMRIAPVILHYN